MGVTNYLAGVKCLTNLAVHDTVKQLLLDAGWLTHDTQATYTVMKSDGIEADGKFMYVKLANNNVSANGFAIWYPNWNATTHTSVGGASIGLNLFSFGITNSHTNYFYANKNG